MQGRALVAATDNGIAVARQGDDGTWEVTEALGGHDVQCLAVDRLRPHRVYAGTEGEGVLRSDDGGSTWRAVRPERAGGQGDRGESSTTALVYVGHEASGLYVSRDGGDSWAGAGRIQADSLALALVLARRAALHRLHPGHRPVADRP